MSTTARTCRQIAAIAVAIIALAPPAAALAADPGGVPSTPPTAATRTADLSVQEQIDAYLATSPDGVQINANELSYRDGAMIVTFRKPGATTSAMTADCPYGYFCLYESVNYVFPRAIFRDCGWQDLYPKWYDRARSIAYNLPYGSVDFINHGKADHVGDTVLFSLSSSRRSIFDVSPHRDEIDHVRRNGCI
ncbi:hypothetical protein F4553_001967 [Allocatelliglobosispora scoriae]|uniref:Peptidase inhibitor family I36 n=1 Tax=Allocatelliglobosispora scoriae TaxID=643052 RepID=A0A841BMI4_9ACTN|nr:hypothetical protein [Allocatelliglobosispora scoriae]MBB5868588.1 hypothetical protein [Allocatelliglobosispora scoriae]